MSSMQNFITWLRSKAKKAKQKTSSEDDLDACDIDLDSIEYPQPRSSVCRSSMKLPPIPRGDAIHQSLLSPNRRLAVPMMGVASLQGRTDSPAHIYEEILITDNEDENEHSDPDTKNKKRVVERCGQPEKVNVSRLDFDQARDFGSFLAVPIRSKLQQRENGPDYLTEENNNQGESDLSISPSSSCDKRSPRSLLSGDQSSDTVSVNYPGDNGSSGDSAIGDISSISHDQSMDILANFHCPRGRRRQGIFNGLAMSTDGKIDMENLEIQTYFNKEMLRGTEQAVERFLIVPSRLAMSEDANNETCENLVIDCPDNSAMKSRDSTQGSDDSNDTCNEYDLRSSDQSSSSHSRPGSYAFDSGSSLYAFSNSDRDKDSLPKKNGAFHSAKHKHQESDSSNDTFSEYDAKPTVEYEYYLSKAQHNLWLKSDVMRVIRESESSEYETTDSQNCQCDCVASKHSDNGSLTTITSLSDISLSDKDDVSSKQKSKEGRKISDKTDSVKCSCNSHVHRKSSKHRNRSKSKNRTGHKHSSEARSEQKSDRTQTDAFAPVPAWERDGNSKSAFTEYRKPHNRKPRTCSRKKAAELYCLPDFSENCAQTLSLDPESIDRLSCRATNFSPPPVPPIPKDSPKKLSLEPKPNLQARTTARTSAAPRQNRILSDLMKMNHDRLLVQF